MMAAEGALIFMALCPCDPSPCQAFGVTCFVAAHSARSAGLSVHLASPQGLTVAIDDMRPPTGCHGTNLWTSSAKDEDIWGQIQEKAFFHMAKSRNSILGAKKIGTRSVGKLVICRCRQCPHRATCEVKSWPIRGCPTLLWGT